MKEFSFNNYLTSNVNADEAQLKELFKHCSRKSFQKGEHISLNSAKQEYIYFVEKGLLRQYSIDEKGKEHVLQFAPEGWFLNNREMLHLNKPVEYKVEALEDTTVFNLSVELLEKLEDEIDGFSTFNKKLMTNHIRHLQYRINLLLSATAEDRYMSFINMYPNILLRVPQWMVATYLGITPESLSRVRKELASKNFNPNS
ncbi:Crp/Fnr family transcriptional regulator [Brumimicrobium aurantiacum]|uniref:Crp/Fnr family transcriptional regulator n=1 Tax=Brumimicrobium aurantiacum TaxID=1737063 RepID=A0A3E1EXZ1_9FLAO|nr:Crp/Fnr family transcriptional regulator [Brumimicrobium aurantiacum]RFC54408.1 Crp/Fnr family transcriptional regulator [Brumimicrobium aurantiacum]